MDAKVEQALERGGIADMTTVGRRTGIPRRIEIYFHHFDGDYFLTGRPGRKRDWLANLITNPEFTLHLKRGVSADIPAVARHISDPEERTEVLYRIITESWDTDPDRAQAILPRWVDNAPLVRFKIA